MTTEEHKKADTYTFTKVGLWKAIAAIFAVMFVAVLFHDWTEVQTGAAQQQVPTQQQQQQQVPTQQQQPTVVAVSADDDAVKGDADAPITIIEFSDFQCPFCSRFYTDTLGQIEKDYIDTGKAKLVFRDFPLSFHPEAQPAALAAECGKEQGKFWEFHDAIFENQGSIGADLYQKIAKDNGLDMAKFNDCISTEKYKSEIQKDFTDGSAAGVSGTPTFFINGVKLVGAQPYQNIKAIIDQELAK